MVNDSLQSPGPPIARPDRDLALAYTPVARRAAFAALLDLDLRFADIVRTTREPLVGQMRLTWWREALEALDTAAAPPEPLLRALHAHVLPLGVSGAALGTLSEGWEVLLDPLDADGIARHAADRGARLFGLAGAVLGGGADGLDAAGQGWALADLGQHLSQPGIADLANRQALPALRAGLSKRWPRPVRPLGVLALLQMVRIEAGSPLTNFARLTRFRITGR